MSKGSKIKFVLFLFIAAFCCPNHSFSQLIINPGISAQELANAIAGPGIQIQNPQITGALNSYGSYSSENTSLPFGNGILLTTGKALNALGPNNVQHKSYINATAGSAMLDTSFGQVTHDACIFEFDLIPQGDTLRFNFTFASEEYHNFVGSIYSDVFGFFISGPGIVGNENIALVPGNGNAVSINTINSIVNSEYFFDNDNPPGSELQYNGYTVNLEAIRSVNPCESYHLTLVIADANDFSIDSGVFIEKIESSNASLSSATAGGIEYMVEGCNDGEITFTRLSENLTQDIVVTFYVDGTALNGIDYLPQIGIDPDPLIPKSIIIPSGSASSSILISPVDDNIPNINKYISIYLASTTCPEILYDSLFFPILDSLIVITGPDTSFCNGENIMLQTIAGGSSWSWTPSEYLNDASIPNPIAQIDTTTLFTLYSTASYCEAWDSTLITVSNIVVTVDSIKPSCYGLDDGIIEISINGGIAPYSLSWIGPNAFNDTGLTLVNLESGIYSYTIVDAIGCIETGDIDINSNDSLTVELNSITLALGYNIACYGDSSGVITSNVNGGSSNYEYLWAPDGQTTANLINVPAGNYTVLVTDDNACFAIDTITLTQAPLLLVQLDSLNNINCYGDQSGYIEVIAIGGVATYNYTWNTNPPTYGNILQNVSAGIYNVSVVDAYGCSENNSFTLSETSTSLNLTIDTLINVLCPGGSEGSASVSASGGSPPYSYSWNTSPIQTNSTATNLFPGSYQILITDSLDCELTSTVEIELLNTPLQASFTSINHIQCYGESNASAAITANGGSGNYTYLWTPGNYTTSSVFGLSAGDYSVLVSDTGACAQSLNLNLTITQPSDSIVISLNSPLINGFNLSCFQSGDGIINSTISGGVAPYTYNWIGPNGYTSSLQDLNNLMAGNYTLEIIDQNNCTSFASVTISQPEQITMTFNMTPASCPTPGSNDGSITISVLGGVAPYTFSWAGPNLFVSNSQDISNLEAGVYYLQIEDAINCITNFTITVTQPDNFTVDPTFSLFPGNWNVSCNGYNDGAIDVLVGNITQPILYSWIFDGMEVSTDSFVTNALAGNYELIIVDANNCIENRFYTLSEPDSILINFNAFEDVFGNSISCFNGSDGELTALITGGTPAYNWLWTSPDNSTNSDTLLQNLTEGIYSLFISDVNACTQEDSITISAPDSLYTSLFSPSSGGVNVSCFNGNNGSIETTIYGGTPPFLFQWIYPGGGIGSTDQNPGNLQEGLYVLFLTDANSCTAIDSINLVASDIINYTTLISDYNGYPNACNGDSLANIEIIPSGGIPPYIVIWANGDTSNTMTALSEGTYTGSIVDSENCISTFSVVIADPNEIVVDFTISSYSPNYQIQCIGDSSGSVFTNISGGVAPYILNWTGPNGFSSTNDSLFDLLAGQYFLSLTDQNNCEYNATIILNEPPLIEITILQLSASTCAGENAASLSALTSGGNGNYIYSWTGPSGFTSTLMTIEDLAPGNYCVEVTDLNGCTSNSCYTIATLSPISISLSSPLINGFNIPCYGDSSGSINSNISGGIPPYEYYWTGPLGSNPSSQNPMNLIAGNYTLIVYDSLGCFSTASIILSEADAFVNTVTSSNYNGYGVSCYGDSNGSISISTINGNAPFTYVWTTLSDSIGTGNALSNLNSELYFVQISDNFGCTMLDSVFISSPDSIALTLFSPEVYPGINISCFGGNDGIVESILSGGVPDYTYSWTSSNGFVSSSQNIYQLIEGEYYLSIIDQNLCQQMDSIVLNEPDSMLMVNTVISIQNSGTNISCIGGNDGSISIYISGGIPNYQIYCLGPDGFSSNDSLLTDLYAGIYFISVVDSASCTFSQEIILTEPADSLYADLTLNNNVCFEDTIASILITPIGGSPDYSISWEGPDGFLSNQFLVENLISGFYNYELIDTNLCNFRDTIEISNAPEILLNETLSDIDCYGNMDGSIVTDPSGGGLTYSYFWNSSNGYSSDQQSIFDLDIGIYCLAIETDLSCSANFCFSINETDSLYANDSLIQPTCGYANGAIILDIIGGSSPFTIDWGIASGPNLSSLVAGVYTAQVIDSLNCSYSFDYELIGPDSLIIDANLQNPSCFNSTNGSISVQISGGTPSYEILWSGPDGFFSNATSISNLSNGNYQLDVIDSLGCSVFEEYDVIMPDSISVEFYSILYDNGYNISTNGSNDGFIGISSVSGGTANFSFSWTGPDEFTSNQMNISNLYAGQYDLNVIDINNCEANFIVVLTQPESSIIPTGFTPNRDGYNDLFVIPGINKDNAATIKIYNRWGNIVYENSNYENNWDGTSKDGNNLPEGTYFIIIEFLSGGESINGYLDLRR